MSVTEPNHDCYNFILRRDQFVLNIRSTAWQSFETTSRADIY